MAKKLTSNWALMELALDVTPRILYHGLPSLGKTYLPTRHKRKTCPDAPVYSVSLTEETPAAELRGHYVPVGGNFEWRDGPALLAWRNGGRLIINEIDRGSADVLSFLHHLLDDPRTAEMTLPTGEKVRPHDNFQVVATMNGKPSDLHEALRSRFPVTFEVVDPNPQAIAALPEDLRHAAQGSCVQPDPQMRIHLRSWFAFAEIRALIGVEKAATMVFGARAQEIVNSLTIAKASK